MASKAISDLEKAPVPQIVQSMAAAISDAQFALDMNAVERLRMMADKKNGVKLPNDTEPRSLLELGLIPSFYHFTETTIEVRVAFSMMQSHEASFGMEIRGEVSVPIKLAMISVAATVSASYTGRYSFESSGSSVISTRLVSVPPPAPLTELINRLAAGKS